LSFSSDFPGFDADDIAADRSNSQDEDNDDDDNSLRPDVNFDLDNVDYRDLLEQNLARSRDLEEEEELVKPVGQPKVEKPKAAVGEMSRKH